MPMPLAASNPAEAGMSCHAEPEPIPQPDGCCSSDKGESAARETTPESTVVLQAPCGCDDHGSRGTPALITPSFSDAEAGFIAAPNALFHPVPTPHASFAKTARYDRAGPLVPSVLQPELSRLSRFLI